MAAVSENELSSLHTSSHFPRSPDSTSLSSALSFAHGRTLVTLCEFRSGGLVGLCCLDYDRAELVVSQLNDMNTYNATMAALYQFDPSLILFPDTIADTPLIHFLSGELQSSLQGARAEAIKRKLFNENTGLGLIELYCTKPSLAAFTVQPCKYLCLAAAAAAIRFVEASEGIRFAPGSLRLCERTITQFTRIDLHTALSLELVSSRVKPANPNPSKRHNKSSVFDVLNYCATMAGARLLRSSLLQPYREKASIEARLDCVAELLDNPSLMQSLAAIIPHFAMFDRIVTTALVRAPVHSTLTVRCHHITHLVKLRSSMESLRSLSRTLANCRSDVLASMVRILSDSNSERIIAIINQVLDSNANKLQTLTDPVQQRHALVFALLPHLSGYLDTERQVYSDTMDDLRREAARISAQCRAAITDDGEDEARAAQIAASQRNTGKKSNKIDCTLEYATAKGGFHLAVHEAIIEKQERLKRGSPQWQRNQHTGSATVSSDSSGVSSLSTMHFIPLGTKGSRRLVTTTQLMSLNARHEEAFIEVMKLCHSVMEQAVSEVRKMLPWLLHVSDEIAMLDMLMSFVRACTAATPLTVTHINSETNTVSVMPPPWVKPVLTKTGPIAIKAARHPLLEHRLSPSPVIPNDHYLTEMNNATVVTGVNKSGKSQYLKTLGVGCILAQIGCYLPATYATVRISDEIIARSATDSDSDSVTHTIGENSSSLHREMKDFASIVARTSNSSRILLLVDEVARGTDYVEGSSLAFALIEWFACHSECYTLVATHFHSLTQLAALYPNVQNLHTQCSMMEDLTVTFEYRLGDGVCKNDSERCYGIRIASMCGMPSNIVSEARVIAQTLHSTTAPTSAMITTTPNIARNNSANVSDSGSVSRRRHHELIAALLSLRHTKMSTNDIRGYLIRIRNEHQLRYQRQRQEESAILMDDTDYAARTFNDGADGGRADNGHVNSAMSE